MVFTKKQFNDVLKLLQLMLTIPIANISADFLFKTTENLLALPKKCKKRAIILVTISKNALFIKD